MKRKNAFWLSLVFAMTFACAPVMAQAAQQDGVQQPPPPPPPPVQGARPALPPATGGMAAQPQPPLLPQWKRDAAAMNAQQPISGPYRLTYTLTEMDGIKRMGSQRYTFVLDADASPAHIAVGADIMIPTGDPASPRRYANVSLQIDANLRQFANGIELRTDLNQEALADGKNYDSSQPVSRKSALRTAVLLSENKPATIGLLDMPGSTHSLQVQVELSKLP